MKPCIKRKTVQRMDRSGEITAFEQCTHMSCSQFSKAVTEDVCDTCPLRQEITPRIYDHSTTHDLAYGAPKVLDDGTLVYEKKGFEPPQEHDGYRRKSNDLRSPEAWQFVPVWPPCRHRKFMNGIKPCGCLRITAVCVCEQCPLFRGQVSLAQCESCKFAEPPDFARNTAAEASSGVA